MKVVKLSPKLEDSICLFSSIGIATLGLGGFVNSVGNYYVKANALVEKVYSLADKITLEVVEKTNEMVGEFAGHPNYLSAFTLTIGAVSSFYFANKLVNSKKYH
jgi:hypothetical protein